MSIDTETEEQIAKMARTIKLQEELLAHLQWVKKIEAENAEILERLAKNEH